MLNTLMKKVEVYEPHRLPPSIVAKCEVCDGDDEHRIKKMERHFQDEEEQAPVQAVCQKDEP